MNRRQKIIISVTGIFLVALILMGLTYAYFLTQITGNTKDKSISVQTADLRLTYGDGTTELLTSTTKLVPSSNPINTKDFTVTNDGDDTKYVVIIENVRAKVAGTENLTTFSSNDFKYTLTCTKSDGTSCNGVSTQTTLPMSDNILVENDIDTGDVHAYVMTVWYLDNGNDQSSDMNKTLEAKINIEDPNRINPYTNKPNSLAYNIINNALNVTNGTSYMKTPLTTPAKGSGNIIYTNYTEPNRFFETGGLNNTSNWFVYGSEITMDSDGYFKITDPQVGQYSTVWTNMKNGYTNNYDGYSTEEEAKAVMNNEFSTIYKVGASTTLNNFCFNSVTKNSINIESVLSITPDDYTESTGINSYYYRGGVGDNYVEFNNMCWRIVRIEGDGSVKLTLAKEGLCSTIVDSDTGSAFIAMDKYGYFDYEKNEMALYNYADLKNSETDMRYILYSWYNGTLTDGETLRFPVETKKLVKNTTVCVGDLKQRYNITTGQLLTRAELDAMAEDEDFSWNYNSYYRLRVDKSPSLICELNGQTSTVHQIYSLTADEVLFAGGSFDINQNYYLIENAKKLGNMANGWWTITPMSAGPGDGWDFAEYVEAQGNIATNHIGDSEANIRPALSLIPGVELANDSGDGTIDNPYVIR